MSYMRVLKIIEYYFVNFKMVIMDKMVYNS